MILRSQALVAHTCNPNYSGGRDQEDCDSKPAPGKILAKSLAQKKKKKKKAHLQMSLRKGQFN
jgi:hypothetical protein